MLRTPPDFRTFSALLSWATLLAAVLAAVVDTVRSHTTNHEVK